MVAGGQRLRVVSFVKSMYAILLRAYLGIFSSRLLSKAHPDIRRRVQWSGCYE